MARLKKKSAPKAPAKKRGRPRSKLPQEVLDRLGPPPEGALARSHWSSRLLAETAWLSLRGEVNREVASEVRAFVGAIQRAQPMDVAAELDKVLRADSEAIEADEIGPQMEKLT